MADEIKQTRTVRQIQPLNPSRDSGRRKQPRKPRVKEREAGKQRSTDDGKPHRVDEYV